MSGPIDRIRDRVDESRVDKRLLALLLLALLVLLGAGVGTIGFPGSGPDDGEPTPTPPVVTVTPTTATPTPTPGGGPTAVEPPTATATPTEATPPTETVPDDDDDEDGGDDEDDNEDEDDNDDDDDPSRVDLTADGSTVFVRAAGVVPGESGRNSVTFENSGDAAGRLLVTDVTVTDSENSLLDPEVAVGDDAATGELSSALRVRLSVNDSDGATEYLFGTPSQYVTLASLRGENRASNATLTGGERATVTVEWELPSATGNEVQSDGAEFDIDFALRQAT